MPKAGNKKIKNPLVPSAISGALNMVRLHRLWLNCGKSLWGASAQIEPKSTTYNRVMLKIVRGCLGAVRL